MALTAALILTGIAIALLVVYGADVVVGYTTDDGQGFIPFNHAARGIGLGVPALILPIIGYVISRRDRSAGLGIMLIIAGILILVGGAVVIGNASSPDDVAQTPPGEIDPRSLNAVADESGRNVVTETAPLIVVGFIQIGLGILKIKRSKSV